MMNRLMRYSCLLLCLSAGLTACDDDGIDVLDIEIPEGYALSAGTSTIFMNSSKAYDSPRERVRRPAKQSRKIVHSRKVGSAQMV